MKIYNIFSNYVEMEFSEYRSKIEFKIIPLRLVIRHTITI